MPDITINGNRYNPEEDQQRLASDSSPEKNPYILIQTSSPLDDDNYEDLHKLKVDVQEYVDNNTYLCHVNAYEMIDPIRKLVFVERVLPYDGFFKVEIALKRGAPTGDVAPAAEQNDVVNVRVVLHKHVTDTEMGETLSEIIADKAGLASNKVLKLDGSSVFQVNDIARRRLGDIAEITNVRDIFEVHEAETATEVSRRTMGSQGLDQFRFGDAQYLRGYGQTIAVADTGLDVNHPAFQPATRILGGIGDGDGHGTHVSGSIAGNHHPELKGHAPGAELLIQTCWDILQHRFKVRDISHLLATAYDQRARVHNNSWVSQQQGTQNLRYDYNAKSIDDFIWRHRDMVACFAAGNEKNQRIGAEAGAKNVITVGSTRTIKNNAGAAIEHVRNHQRNGPTEENRHKPDVVAPGFLISSAAANAALGTLWAEKSGTSMSTALVSGCAAVVREALAHENLSQSADLVKALLIGGGQDISRGNRVFNRVDIANSVGMCCSRSFEQDKLRQGSEISYPIRKRGVAARLKVVLVWIDPPGPRLQTQLRLVVTANGQQYSPSNAESNVLEVRVDSTNTANVKIVAERVTRRPGERVSRYQEFSLAWKWEA